MGQRLRALRARRVLSLRELSKLSGVAVSTIVLLEQDAEANARRPHPATIRKLAKALDVSPAELAIGD